MQRQETRQIKCIVAANIRRAREAARLTQRELGDRLDIDGPSVSRWETGRVMPRTEFLVALAEATNRDVAWFYTDHDREPANPAAA